LIPKLGNTYTAWALVLVVTLAVGCGSAGSGANEEIAFVVPGPRGTTHIVSVDADGNQRRDITLPSDPPVGRPAWSPIDPKTILVDGEAVSLVDPTTGAQRSLAAGSGAVWAPDGKRVALYQPEKGIVIVSVSGGKLREISWPIKPKAVDTVELAWSPTRSELAVALTPETPSGFPPRHLYRVPVDRGAPKLLLKSGGLVGPRWLPDGDQIAYRTELSDGIWAIGRDGGRAQRLERGVRVVAWSRSGQRAVAVLEPDGIFSSIFIDDKRVLSGAAVAGWTSDLTWSPAGDALAVATEKGAFLITSDGRKLAQLDGEAKSPSFSPDGSRVALLLDSELVVADRDGGNRRFLSRPHSDEHPVWSPDGTKIAFERRRPGRASRIVVANADGSAQRELGWGASPQWARNGTALVVVGRDPFGGVGAGRRGIWVLDADGGGQRKIADGMHHSVSTDGTRVAFIRETSVQIGSDGYIDSSTLFTVRVDGTGLRRIAATQGTEAAHFTESIWLPGDEKLVVRGQSIVETGLYIVSLDGQKEFIYNVIWDANSFAAHGDSLAIIQEYPRDELVVRRQGRDPVRIPPPKAGHLKGPLSWSADGQRLALWVVTPTDRGSAKEEIYIVDSDGSGLRPIAEGGSEARFHGGPAWRPRRGDEATGSG
jgi:Tol biopolymer transport system component